MKNLKLKIITGFRKDQFHTIDADEGHKAYWLFLHPEQRGIFKNGVPIIGADIRTIVEDYNATMGWNADHDINADDMNDIRSKGIDRELRDALALAKNVAQLGDATKINLPLSEIKLLL